MSEPILTRLVGEYEIAILGRKSDLTTGTNPIRIEVTDTESGEKKAVDTVSLQLDMDMPGMQIRAQGRFEEAADVGAYVGVIKIDIAGEWIAHLGITIDGKSSELAFTVIVEP